jgi:hypothetical protein
MSVGGPNLRQSAKSVDQNDQNTMKKKASTNSPFQSSEVAERLECIRAGGRDWREHVRWHAYHFPKEFGPLDKPLLWEDMIESPDPAIEQDSDTDEDPQNPV